MGLGTSLVYMVLLGFGSLITPGVGISGRLLELVPCPLSQFSHAPAYGLLTWLLASGLRGREWPQHVALCVAMPAALNAIGIGAASLLIGLRLLPIDEPSRRWGFRRLLDTKRGCSAS
jgi:hypothetical protein